MMILFFALKTPKNFLPLKTTISDLRNYKSICRFRYLKVQSTAKGGRNDAKTTHYVQLEGRFERSGFH